MASFKSYIGKQVMVSFGVFTFTKEVMETDNEDIISRLEKAADVERLKEGKKSKSDKDE
jgi:hypothetical protein